MCTPLHLASAYAWTNTPSSVVWLRDQEPGVHGLSVLGFGHCWSCVLIEVVVALHDLHSDVWL
jgi:hypothetical protein